MPSPIGHALAGLATAWSVDLVPGDRAWRTAPAAASWYKRAGNGLTLACAALAAAPDLDLLIPRFHRSITHSVTAVAAAGLVAALVAARARRPVARVTAMCAGAWATHLLLDWLGVDRLYAPFGIQMLWPFSHAWFISGWDVFAATERHDVFGGAAIRENVAAVIQEVAIVGPVALAVWLVRVKAFARLLPEQARRDHPAE
jgi:membrane-bound metal-dependent hydrolase YbcI (DUF457 family)